MGGLTRKGYRKIEGVWECGCDPERNYDSTLNLDYNYYLMETSSL